MGVRTVTCTMCGQTFDPQNHAACQACPLNKGCTLICCPACGFEMVDVEQSRLAQWAARWLKPRPQAEAAQNIMSHGDSQ